MGLLHNSPSSIEFSGTADLAVLVIHGFTSTTASVADWARAIHSATDDAARHPSVSVPLLPGHGTSWQELAQQHWSAWRDAVDQEYWRLRADHHRVVVCGISMGGTLAVHLAQRYPVEGLILVNPALKLMSRLAAVAGVLAPALPSVKSISNDIKREGIQEESYERTPVKAVAQLGVMLGITRRSLPAVTTPTLIFRSGEDHVVSGRSVDLFQDRTQAPTRVVELPDSFHVATLDNDRHLIENGSREAVQAVLHGGTVLDVGAVGDAAATSSSTQESTREGK